MPCICCFVSLTSPLLVPARKLYTAFSSALLPLWCIQAWVKPRVDAVLAAAAAAAVMRLSPPCVNNEQSVVGVYEWISQTKGTRCRSSGPVSPFKTYVTAALQQRLCILNLGLKIQFIISYICCVDAHTSSRSADKSLIVCFRHCLVIPESAYRFLPLPVQTKQTAFRRTGW